MKKADELAIYVTCDICQGRKCCGPSIYDGRGVRQWGIWACNNCRLTNDVPPVYDLAVTTLLNSKGISYRRNQKGLIIIPN